ncbi:hypothetical protein CAter10_2058 [Collimonas arenae]|nr:hypothetical protein CAter10_2058 [Collimonas arenae]
MQSRAVAAWADTALFFQFDLKRLPGAEHVARSGGGHKRLPN